MILGPVAGCVRGMHKDVFGLETIPIQLSSDAQSPDYVFRHVYTPSRHMSPDVAQHPSRLRGGLLLLQSYEAVIMSRGLAFHGHGRRQDL